MKEEVYDRLEQASEEAKTSRREDFEESMRRQKAEEDAAKARRKESELEIELEDPEEYRQKFISAMVLLEVCENERDEWRRKYDNTLRVVEELRTQVERLSVTYSPKFSEFSLCDIEKATNLFDPVMKIGEGGYGSVYRGLFHHTEIAIKVPNPDGLQGPQEYQQEVDVLSKLRHPNIVTLIGACPEASALIYEYLPNGSLEDRLSCKDNSPPLSWQARIRIAAELCSVLIFLHSSEPNSIVHGDLNPANVLLDANFVCKLGGFGICRVIPSGETSAKSTTMPKGTSAYTDPVYLSTGEVRPDSDVYSFGIILLRLLTGEQASGIIGEVECALDEDILNLLLDGSAGEWPFVWASQLAHLALRCCDRNRKSRPGLVSDVWRVLEPMKLSCGNSSSLRLGGEDNYKPSYFICPIFLEVMQDPHVAADGFTYEAEAIRGWLGSGRDTSPMTGLELANHNLIPNRALRSAIHEWKQQRGLLSL